MRLGGTRRLTTEGCLKFDASALRRDGVFVAKPGTLFTITWTDPSGQEILRATLWLELEASGKLALRIVYGDFNALPAPANLSRLTIELVTTPCHFGGQRFWFLCPLTRGGIPCKKRVGVVYLPAGAQFFGCRTCWGLTYRSCQEHNKRLAALLTRPDEFRRLLASDDLKERLLAFRAGTLLLRRIQKKADFAARKARQSHRPAHARS